MIDRTWVALVGPPAAGKTTFARTLTACDPEFHHSTDLAVLQELVALEGGSEHRADYWQDFAMQKQAARRTEPVPGGGFHILDPTVWDDALRHVIARHRSHPRLVVEFARGNDPGYLKRHGVSEQECYEPSFQLLADELGRSPRTAFVILHVAAPTDVRMARNRARRQAGCHSVAEDVMRSVYARDVLDGVPLRQIGAGLAAGAFRIHGIAPVESNVRAFISWWTHRVKAEGIRA